jgi:hypothetical protein
VTPRVPPPHLAPNRHYSAAQPSPCWSVVCYIRSEAQERVGIRHLSIDVYSAAAHLDLRKTEVTGSASAANSGDPYAQHEAV